MSQKTPTRAHNDTSTDTTSTNTDTEDTTCPECGGDVTPNANGTEYACTDCGLIVSEDTIDHGPEWRAFNATENDQKSRVGAPTTNLRHDNGLSTTIGWQDKDANGNTISGKKREQVRRLRKWNRREQTSDATDRNLRFALGELQRMGSELDLPKNTQETASAIYRRALKEDLIRGRRIESMISAAIVAACRSEGIPRTITDITATSRVERRQINRARRYISDELNLEIQPSIPMDYIPQIASRVGITNNDLQRLSEYVLREFTNSGLHSGKNPAGCAAASLYVIDQLNGQTLTQTQLADAANVSEVTIRERRDDIVEFLETVDLNNAPTPKGTPGLPTAPPTSRSTDTRSPVTESSPEPESEPSSEVSASAVERPETEPEPTTATVTAATDTDTVRTTGSNTASRTKPVSETRTPTNPDMGVDETDSVSETDAVTSDTVSSEIDSAPDTDGSDDDTEWAFDGKVLTPDDGEEFSITQTESETQVEMMARAVESLITDYGLLDELESIPWQSGSRTKHYWINNSPDDGSDSDYGTWTEVVDGVYLQTKLNRADKRRRIEEFATRVGFDSVTVDFK